MKDSFTSSAGNKATPETMDQSIGADFFFIGGTLSIKAPSYVKRPADDELLEYLLRGEFCFVLTPRQMGKSSLMYRTADRLEKQDVRTVKIDLTGIGRVAVSIDQWYLGLLNQIRRTLKLPVDEAAWWDERKTLSYVVRFLDFLGDVLLEYIKGHVVIFIDEIDSTLSLDFRDDFFAAIRAVYNQRSDRPAFQRLTFAMLGVAAPTDLIKDKNITPFNIGYGIALQEFSLEDAGVLSQGLQALHPLEGEQIFRRIYEWTSGHPYLTQRLCKAVAEQPQKSWTDAEVDQLVERLFLKEEARKNDNNLRFVQERVLSSPQRSSLLDIYRKVISGRVVHDDGQSIVQNQLKLSGLVEVEDDLLQVRNRIYQRAFDHAWVRKNTPTRWPMLAAVVSVLLALAAIALLWNDGVRIPGEVQRRLNEFPQPDQPSERLAVLSYVIQAQGIVLSTDYDPLAIDKFYGLPREEQIGLFPAEGCQLTSPNGAEHVVLEISKTLADVNETGETTPLLEAMASYLKCLKTQTETSEPANLEAATDLYAMFDDWLQGRKLVPTPSVSQDINSLRNAVYLYRRAIASNQKLDSQQQLNPSLLFEHARLLVRIYANDKALGQPPDTRLYEEALNDLDQIWGIALSRPVSTPTSLPSPAPVTPTGAPAASPTFLFTQRPSLPATTRPPTNTPQPVSTPTKVQAVVTEDNIPTPTITAAPSPTPLPERISSEFRTSGDWQSWVRKLLADNYELWLALGNASKDRYPNLFKAGLNTYPTATPTFTSTPTSFAAVTSFAPRFSLETNTDRPGMDYVSSVANDADACAMQCMLDDKCQAFTFANLGNFCYLKDGIPPAAADSCCTSGIRISTPLTSTIPTTALGYVPVDAVPRASFLAQFPLYSVQYSPNQDRLVTAGEDGTARIWDVKSGEVETVLYGHTAQVNQARFSPDGMFVVTAGSDSTARLWEVSTGKELKTLFVNVGIDYEPAVVFEAAFSPDGKKILTTSTYGDTQVWDFSSGKELLTLSGHKNVVTFASFSPDGRYIATSSWDATAILWDAQTGKQIFSITGHEGPVNCVSFSPDSQQLVTASDDRTIRTWDVASGQEVSRFQGHQDFVQTAVFSPDGRRIVSAGWDNTARIWNAMTGDEIIVLAGHTYWVESASFSPDGEQVITASFDGTMRIWDTQTGALMDELPGHRSPVYSAELSPGGNQIVTASADGLARLWDAASETLLQVYRGHAGIVADVAINPDGSRLATASGDGMVRVWDVFSGRELLKLEGHTGGASSAAFSPDGLRLVTTGWDEKTYLWNAQTGQLLLQLDEQAGPGTGNFNDAAFSPDGSLIATTAGGAVRVLDATSGQELLNLGGDEDHALSVNFSPDGTLLSTAHQDGTVRIWDAKSGGLLKILMGHLDWARSSGFSPDGRFLITSGMDFTVRIWEVSSGAEVLKFTVAEQGLAYPMFDMGISWAAFSPDGQQLVTTGFDGQTILWDLMFMPWEALLPAATTVP